MLLAALIAAIAFRLLLPDMRRSTSAVMSALVRDRGIRPSGPRGTWPRRDRLLAPELSAAGAVVLVATCTGAYSLAKEWPRTRAAMAISGVGFVAALLGMLGAVASVPHRVRAPFAPAAAEWA